jgi:5-formyltetrahydrofolate cyclo-ligase
MSDEVSLQKRALRAELRERRRTRTSTERAADGAQLTTNLEQLAQDLELFAGVIAQRVEA